MDPITINKFLSVVDAIETHRVGNKLPFDTFTQIVDNQGRIKNLKRRVGEILRIFVSARWITRNDQKRNELFLTKNHHEFIRAWDSGDDFFQINEGLTNYPPYFQFLKCLKNEKRINIPSRGNRDSRKNLGYYLKQNYGITFVAFDTFRTWALSAGHAFPSQFGEILNWGGDWDIEQPTLNSFKIACLNSYTKINKTSGYANLGRLAHLVCMELSISYQAFEMKMNLFLKSFPGEFHLAPATIRNEVARNSQFTSIRPRKDIIRERLSARFRGETIRSQWIIRRYLEDGMRVNRKLVKLIRWELSR